MSNRYKQIKQFIEFIKPKIFTEAGIDDFAETERLIQECFKANDELVYFGLGLPDKINEYEYKLEELKVKIPNLQYFLINLNDEIDLEQNYMITDKKGDMVSLTIKNAHILFCNDLNDVQDFVTCLNTFNKTPCIILNKVYQTEDEELLKRSVNPVLSKIKHITLPVEDSIFVDGDIVNVKLAVTGSILEHIKQGNQSEGTNKPQNPGQINIQTKNAMPNEVIQKQVEDNILFARMTGIKEIMPCQIHNSVAYMIGGGLSYKSPENMRMLKKSLKEPGHLIFSSKTALPYLLENKITPYACILLDPREHIPSFVEKTNNKVIYFVASQCHPDTLQYLHSQGVKVFLYHAAVNAGEAEVLKRMKTISPLVGGGSTSVTRGIGLLQMLGFYQFKLFGIDSSYPTKPERVHGYNQEKQALEVSMSDSKTNSNIGKKYWTDPELIAQANDIEMIMKNWFNIKIENYSEGMMKDMFNYLQSNRRLYKDFVKY